jgi:predicted MFS family arabinose efflux permease
MVVTTYVIAHGSIQLLIGPVGDRFGKYLTVTVMSLASSILVMLCGYANSLSELAVARLLAGATAGWIIPLSMAYVGDVTPYERRQTVLGRYISGYILGQLFGQAAGGVLGEWFGWRNVFVVLGALFALATVGLIVELLTSPGTRPDATGGDVARLRRRLCGRPLQSLCPHRHHCSPDRGVRRLGRLRLCGRRSQPPLWAWLCGGGTDRRHLRARRAPLYGERPATGQPARQRGLAIGGGLLCGIAYPMLAIGTAWWLAPIAVTMIGLGFYALHNTLQTNATQMTPEARGTAVAIFSSAIYFGQTGGVAVGAFIFDRFGGAPLFAVTAIVLPVLALWFARKLKYPGS